MTVNLLARLIALERRHPPDEHDTDARERLAARLDALASRRRDAGEMPRALTPAAVEAIIRAVRERAAL